MPTILVVDDEDDVRVVVRKMLEQDGYTVLDTGLPLKALDLVKAGGIDLVLTDVVMPVMKAQNWPRWSRRSARTRRCCAAHVGLRPVRSDRIEAALPRKTLYTDCPRPEGARAVGPAFSFQAPLPKASCLSYDHTPSPFVCGDPAWLAPMTIA